MIKCNSIWKAIFPALCILCAACGLADAHGTTGAVIEKRAVCVYFSYDDGEPMGYAKVSVQAPALALPYQSGATDMNGVFCFAPDRKGDWQVSANDGMGHLNKQLIKTDEENAALTTSNVPTSSKTSQNKIQQALPGVGIILSVAGLISLYQSRRRKNKGDRNGKK